MAVWATTPDRFTIDTGAEHLALARLSPNGAYRWYAECCGTQIGVTSRTPRFPFVSLVDTIVQRPEALGPVRAHVSVPKTGGGTGNGGAVRMVPGLFGRTISALVSGA